ncbi:MAG: OPT/YSL family transporter [Saprospiraceae bacterium]|nr:OPT/YSL family transporter [Saprospiraceae bacterium]HMW37969.1 OPT/YSL family transporter [Saprospiraceae bacterium]HMX87643.1 OPT/YSL family transporter [Saprospiraceae bacterium]HMZ39458.1 OPT/YSL family transporter [Saprospiraceae bacterium]HNA63244.1 OPT/YSL family transporter [Saprospiraceae bacterium]
MSVQKQDSFKPYVDPNVALPELTIKAIILGILFGVIFGASTVYLALKAGLTVSASIPIAVLAISLGRKLLGTNILENNIIQTTGSAGESIAAGVVFTLPAFLFLSDKSVGENYFNYWTIFTLAVFGGILGTLMMIPLRRSLIVKEHETLPYPEGTACAQVLIAGEKGGDFARTAYYGLGFSLLYAIFQKVFHLIAEVPKWGTQQVNKYFPSAIVAGEITPEYLGVGYIIGPRIAGVLVAGGILASLGLIPLLSYLVNPDIIAAQLAKLNLLDITKPSARFGWDPQTHTLGNTAEAVYRAYIRQIGAGAVAAGGFITLLKTIPTIIASFKESLGSMKEKSESGISRTEDDLSFKVVLFGSLGLIILLAVLPQVPGTSIVSKLLLGVLVILFGFFFVTVSSRIVGIIGSSNNPISGMTIATIMGTALVFIAVGWTGQLYEPMALVIGGMICIAAANAGATSQDLKTGYIVGATPRYQQIALFIGAIFSSIVIGFTVKYLDTPTSEMMANGIQHAIGEKYNAPQATLMATLIKGLLSFNLDWVFVLSGVFIAIVLELCQVKALSFAVGLYLPLSTTLPIFIGGLVKGIVDWNSRRKNKESEDSELGKGSLFATGLVAGGALAGVIVALLTVNENVANSIGQFSAEHSLSEMFGTDGYNILGVIFFAIMAWVLYRIGSQD